MPKYRIEQFLQEATVLPPISQAVTKALSLMRNPRTNATDLSKILSSDQVLSAQVLRWSNSAYYGMMRQIVSVQQAIVVLGMDVIYQMIMASSVSEHLCVSLPGYGLQRGELWCHALGTAVGARLISKRYGLRIDEEAYFGGLLCDIGKLIFEKHLRKIDLVESAPDHTNFLEVERAQFGMDHATLGAALVHHWQLPEELESAIAFHHEPRQATQHKTLVAAIHLADLIMTVLGIGMGIDGLRYPVDEEALRALDMTWNDLFLLSEQVAKELEHMKELIDLNETPGSVDTLLTSR